MSHPGQRKYGACKAINKHGQPCGLAVVRNGRCMYHQSDESRRRLLHKKTRLERELALVNTQIESHA